MGIFGKIFKKQTSNRISENISVTNTIPTINDFPQLNSTERLKAIMFLGDSGKLEYFPFLKFAILNDADVNVKFAALKRIHLFKNHEETIPLLTDLKRNRIGESFEPYFSMALSQLGIITLQEFEDKINKSK